MTSSARGLNVSKQLLQCVCGHDEEFHYGDGCMHGWENRYCACELMRPILGFPDSPGAWWCDKQSTPVTAAKVGRRIVIYFNESTYGPASFRMNFGKARFSKVVEENPLPQAADNQEEICH